MAGFQRLLAGLRRAEKQLEKQLEGIRAVISSLEFGGAVSPGFKGIQPIRGLGRRKGAGKKRQRRKPRRLKN